MFRSERAVVSISGGADSDMMLDMIQALEPEQNYPNAEIHYVWFNTGMEYTATKRHLDYLEAKYGITIERRKANTPVPIGCKTWGQPFLSKRISQYISRLQAHGFQWENERLKPSMLDTRIARRPCAGGATILGKEVS